MIVHVLFQGLPLCGFSKAVPRDWPAGHSWVALLDPRCTCAECKTAGASVVEAHWSSRAVTHGGSAPVATNDDKEKFE